MTEPQARLWDTLQGLPFGPADAVISFDDKLIRQTGWTRHFAGRAVAEYRRYLLLAATAGHPVSPPPAVDEVWHLHLLYTRDYWQHLCPQVLKFDLHHEPATGAPTNRAGLDNSYASTRASYRDAFGEPPPDDIWPMRASSGRFVRVDADRFIILPRRAWQALVVLVGLVGLALIGTILLMAFR